MRKIPRWFQALVRSELDQDALSASARRAHLAILAVLQLVMAIQLILLLMGEEWPEAFFVAGIMVVTLAPVVFRMPVDIPSEIRIVAMLFIFATLFLGEVME